MSPLVRSIAERGGHWIRIVMDAPRGNLLSLRMVRDLDQALDAAVTGRGVRWLTIEGAGGEFSFGADLKEHRPEPMRTVLPATHALLRRWLAVPVPTAALVEGRCLGGGFELALCCDDILAHGRATFGCPEVNVAAFAPIGFAAAAATGRRLARLAGARRGRSPDREVLAPGRARLARRTGPRPAPGGRAMVRPPPGRQVGRRARIRGPRSADDRAGAARSAPGSAGATVPRRAAGD